jgi:2-keto-4-pentenoate hydratase/2-oxohepta-3-ene-1,7-dioic acid hydratase in catechol pathway
MKLVTYSRGDAAARAGMLVDAGILDLEESGKAVGVTLGSDVLSILRQEAAGMAALRAVEAAASSLPTIPLDGVELGPALATPPKILLLAANYQSHITESGAPEVDKATITPRFFLKPGSAVIGPGDAIEIPSVSDAVDYEIEIAAVVGRRGRAIPLSRAEEHVFGYVLFNDISARHLKVTAGRKERNGDWFFDWLVGKWCDTFAVVGPWLVSIDEAPDVRQLEMSLRVNGELRQHSSAGEMIFTVPEAVAWISRFVTLEPGDLICMGTPGGVGETTQTYLQPGDEVEATIEGLGRSVNPVRGAT